jgi:uncharacterized protein YggU (UPF0235/DUF167 family)
VTAASSAPAVSCAGVSKGFLIPTKDGTLLNLRVSPADGKAEVERFLAKLLGVSRSDVIRGASSRDKAILARSLKAAEALKALSTHLR